MSDSWEGTGSTLEEAANAAWETAKHDPNNPQKPGKFKLEIKEIYAENPIRSYTVIIKP